MADEGRPDERSAESTDLRAALRRARLSEAERSDVIVDLRQAELARLELLGEKLEPMLLQLPPDSDLIDCQVVPGYRPRLWIDMLAYVQMARDRRGYELVSESRAGRQVLFHSEDVGAMAGKVTDYIAHRLVERDRLAARTREPAPPEPDAPRSPALPAALPIAPGAAAVDSAGAQTMFWRVAFAFMLGVVTGIVALLVLGLIVTE